MYIIIYNVEASLFYVEMEMLHICMLTFTMKSTKCTPSAKVMQMAYTEHLVGSEDTIVIEEELNFTVCVQLARKVVVVNTFISPSAIK